MIPPISGSADRALHRGRLQPCWLAAMWRRPPAASRCTGWACSAAMASGISLLAFSPPPGRPCHHEADAAPPPRQGAHRGKGITPGRPHAARRRSHRRLQAGGFNLIEKLNDRIAAFRKPRRPCRQAVQPALPPTPGQDGSGSRPGSPRTPGSPGCPSAANGPARQRRHTKLYLRRLSTISATPNPQSRDLSQLPRILCRYDFHSTPSPRHFRLHL